MSERPTRDLVILLFVGTVCAASLGALLLLGILAVVYPERDLSRAFAALANVYSTLLGVLAGYLIRARSNGSRNGGPDDRAGPVVGSRRRDDE